jgi:hypothetical protein
MSITWEHAGSISNNTEGIADEFTAVNPLDETISLPIGSKTCYCVATDFSDVDLRPHESVPVKPTFTPVNSLIRHLGIRRQIRSRENIHKIIDRDLKDV